MTSAGPQFDDLYREMLLEHYRDPRNHGTLANPTFHLEGLNPVCGDEIRLDVLVEGDVLADMAFEGQGCSISQSSASMMTERLKGRTVAEGRQVKSAFEAMLTGGAAPAAIIGDLEALQGVASFPVRVKCALLPWKVLEEALGAGAPGGGTHD